MTARTCNRCELDGVTASPADAPIARCRFLTPQGVWLRLHLCPAHIAAYRAAGKTLTLLPEEVTK